MSQRVVRVALPGAAIALTVVMLAGVIAYASYTLGYDYLAYDDAARRFLAGGSPYDLSFQQAGPFGLFYYPPTFLLALVPFVQLPQDPAMWVWMTAMLGSAIAGIALLPVSGRVRWMVLLLASISWPFLFSIKVGQVGPLLLLLYAVGWRWLGRPAALGLATAAGAAIKLQPALVFAWMLLVGRWRALVIGAVALAVAAIAITLAGGWQLWTDFVTLLRQVADPITTPVNFTPGATAYGLGASMAIARGVQLVSTLIVLAAVVVAARWTTADASYLVAVEASVLVSPILWDHYALFLLLPVAWLLERGQWWAVLIPLSQSALLLNVTPPIGWLAGYLAILLALLLLGRREAMRVAAVRPVFTGASS